MLGLGGEARPARPPNSRPKAAPQVSFEGANNGKSLRIKLIDLLRFGLNDV